MRKLFIILFILSITSFNLFAKVTDNQISKHKRLLTSKYNIYKHYVTAGNIDKQKEAILEYKDALDKYKSLMKKKYEDELLKTKEPQTVAKKTAPVKKDQYGYVNSSAYYLNFRTGPGINNSIIKTIPSGKSIKILTKNSNGWYKVEVDGKTGWVSGKYVNILKDGKEEKFEKYSKPKTAYVNAAIGLNFRTGPSLGKSIIKALPNSTKVSIIGKSGEWYKVNVNGQEGWVSSKYLSDGKPYKVASTAPKSNKGKTVKYDKVTSKSAKLAVPVEYQIKGSMYYGNKKSFHGQDYGRVWCGPTSMQMVLGYYGIDYDRQYIAEKCNYEFRKSNKTGTGISGLVNCGKSMGFKNTHAAWSKNINWLKETVSNKKPVIVLVDTKWKGHYVVVTGFENGKIICNDPASGQVKEYSESYFYTMWKSRGKHAVVVST